MLFSVFISTFITWIFYLFIIEFHSHYALANGSIDEQIVSSPLSIKPMMRSMGTASNPIVYKRFHLTFMDWIMFVLVNLSIGQFIKAYPAFSLGFIGPMFIMILKWWFTTASFVLLKIVREESIYRNSRVVWDTLNKETELDTIIILYVMSFLFLLTLNFNRYSETVNNGIKMLIVILRAVIVSIMASSFWTLIQSDIIDIFLENMLIHGKLMAILAFNHFIFFSVYHFSYDMAAMLNQKFSSNHPSFIHTPLPIFNPLADDITTFFIFHLLYCKNSNPIIG